MRWKQKLTTCAHHWNQRAKEQTKDACAHATDANLNTKKTQNTWRKKSSKKHAIANQNHAEHKKNEKKEKMNKQPT